MTGLYSPSDQHKMPPEAVAALAGGGEAPPSAASAVAALPESARNAPTAGAAAAAAAAAARLDQDIDFYILSEIANSGANRDSEVDWNSMRVDNANTRWNELFQEWQTEVQPEEQVLESPVSEIARILLERKQQAKMAAEMVEAVDLPTLKSREV